MKSLSECPPVTNREKLSRRSFLQIMAVLTSILALLHLSGCSYGKEDSEEEQKKKIEEAETAILQKIKELQFVPSSSLSTTLLLRKIGYEIQKTRNGGSSEWMEYKSDIEAAIQLLADAGISGGRLAILPFEITQNGEEYDWTALDTAIEMMAKANMAVDLCIGPLQYPYDPGVRLPIVFENAVKEEMNEKNVHTITIDVNDDPLLPNTSKRIREYGLRFLEHMIRRYGSDSRIRMFCLANEWPDTNAIEGNGMDGKTLSVSEAYMSACIEIIKKFTAKPVMMNTNIHPSRIQELCDGPVGRMMEQLGTQAVLAFDLYPTEEQSHPEEMQSIPQLHDIFEEIRKQYPGITISYGEFQAELYAKGDLAGKPWSEFFDIDPNLVRDFFMNQFPRTLQTHIIDAGITEVSLWGAPMWLALALKEYTFPLRMIQAIVQRMKECSE